MRKNSLFHKSLRRWAASLILALGLLASSLISPVHAATLCAAPGGASGCYPSIQAAVNAAAAGDTVLVYPGDYNETAPDSVLYNNSGPYQFGVFVSVAKENLSIRGVDAGGNFITSYANVAANVTTNATNSFGTSGFFVEANGVTISGLRFLPNVGGDNKTVEVIGDNFTLLNSVIDIPGGGSIYLNDWRFNQTTNTSYVKAYHIEGNHFAQDASLDISSGAGYSGPTSGRIISNNVFNYDSSAFWPPVSFNGFVNGIGWFVDPVSGATITGNQFSGAEQYIRARGVYNEPSFDWASYWNNNTYDKAVITGPDLPGTLRAYSYTSGSVLITNVRHIGATLQGEIDNAATGDAVWAKAGTYPEKITVGKDLQITGAGEANTIIQWPATLTITTTKNLLTANNGATVSLTGLTLSGPMVANGCGDQLTGAYIYQGATLSLSHVTVKDIRASSNGLLGCQMGLGIRAGAYPANGYTAGHLLANALTVTGYQKGGIVINGTGTTSTIDGATITGDGNSPYIAQNGIQVSRGAVGTITNATISGNLCDVPSACGADPVKSDQSAGILLYNADASTTVVSNTTSGNDIGIYAADANTSATLIDSNLAVANRYEGIFLDQGTFTVTNNELSGASNIGILSVTMAGATANSTASIRNNIIAGATKGIQILDGDTTDSFHPVVNAQLNNIQGSTFGVENTTTQVMQAIRNWWGSPKGPTTLANPGGNGVSISGSIHFAPWLCGDGADTEPGVRGYQPALTPLCTNVATHMLLNPVPDGIIDHDLFPAVTVKFVDDDGNLAINNSSTVQVVLVKNPTTALLYGTTAISALGGIATFSNLRIDKIGTGYALLASSSGFPSVISNDFAIDNLKIYLPLMHNGS